jgi:hypothetical protein
MERRITAFLKPALALGLCLFASGAWAQATRTWVSGVGDDANPCSRTAPCKTFAGAISKTAAKGVISVLDPGGFGAVTITKSITIDGGGVIGSILGTGTNGIIVNAGASDVVRLRNLSIDGSTTGLSGVRFLAGGSLFLDNVRIHDFAQGVYFLPSGSSRLVIVDSILSNNSSVGVFVQPGAAGLATVSIAETKLYGNGHGLRADDRSVVSIRQSDVASNVNSGLFAMSGSQAVEIAVDNCQVTNNGVANPSSGGVKASGPLASIVISDNVITGNYNGINATGGGDVFSFGSNRVTSNTVDGTPTGTLTSR